MRGLNISFIGGGNMARSMIGGLIENGIESRLIRVGEPDLARRQELVANFRIKPFVDNFSAIKNSDVIIFAVKPQIIREVISPLADYLTERRIFIIVNCCWYQYQKH